MEAIILAGGLGTRLRSIVSDIPKPMAPIDNKPFLWYLFEYLCRHNIKKVVMSIGYKHEIIESYFGDNYKDIYIAYSIEKEPLGTGGAIKKALGSITSPQVFIINGDTFFNVNLLELSNKHLLINSDLTLSLKPMKNFDRYGTVITLKDRIIKFQEKRYTEAGNINGGVYIANTSLFDGLDLPKKFSFEKDFVEVYLSKLNFSAYISDTYFIDIGIPEDYEKAKKELPKLI